LAFEKFVKSGLFRFSKTKLSMISTVAPATEGSRYVLLHELAAKRLHYLAFNQAFAGSW